VLVLMRDEVGVSESASVEAGSVLPQCDGRVPDAWPLLVTKKEGATCGVASGMRLPPFSHLQISREKIEDDLVPVTEVFA